MPPCDTTAGGVQTCADDVSILVLMDAALRLDGVAFIDEVVFWFQSLF